MVYALLMLAFFGAIAVAYFLLNNGGVASLTLPDELNGTGIDRPETFVSLGDEGISVSRLNPMGRAEFNGKEIEVVCREGLIEAGTQIKVVRLEQGKVTVKPINTH